MAKQLSLLKKQNFIHGGLVAKGNPRQARPLCSKRPIHLVMKSSKATGARSFLAPKNKIAIEKIIEKQAIKFGVKVYEYANAGNHLHLAIKIMSAPLFKKFIRAVTGLIARLITQAEKGRPKNQKFWDARPFTRVTSWGRAYENLKNYLRLNVLEALGFITYQDRKKKGAKIFSVKIEPLKMEATPF